MNILKPPTDHCGFATFNWYFIPTRLVLSLCKQYSFLLSFSLNLNSFCLISLFHLSVFSPYFFCQLHSSPFLRCLICFSKLCSPSSFTLSSCHMSFIDASYNRPGHKCGLKRDFVVTLLDNMDGNATKLNSSILCARADNVTDTL